MFPLCSFCLLLAVCAFTFARYILKKLTHIKQETWHANKHAGVPKHRIAYHSVTKQAYFSISCGQTWNETLNYLCPTRELQRIIKGMKYASFPKYLVSNMACFFPYFQVKNTSVLIFIPCCFHFFSVQPKPVNIYIQKSCPGCLATKLGGLGGTKARYQMQSTQPWFTLSPCRHSSSLRSAWIFIFKTKTNLSKMLA